MLVVGDDSLKALKVDQRYDAGIVPLSEYRDSNFERDRQRYETQVGPVDVLPTSEMEGLIIRSVRFAKWLRFYDPYIGRGNNTEHFRKGIEYILSFWEKHGFFASQQGIGGVEIFTCNDQHIPIEDQQQKIIQELTTPLKHRFPWPIKCMIKVDGIGSDRIFHARFLEAEHAIIQVDSGFDLFKRNGGFRRNFFTLNMAGSLHLRECRDLPNADL